MNLYDYIHFILDTPLTETEGINIGTSVEGHTIQGFQFGKGIKNISLIAGNHADEPIGPLLLKKLVSYFSSLPENHFLLEKYSWWIVPHTNPDGEKQNLKWYNYTDTKTDLAQYLLHVQRELPGRDLEFGYPIEGKIPALRPENTAVYDFWKTANTPFSLHASLHGMKSSYGAWFLIDEAWIERTKKLRQDCKDKTIELGYDLYDLERKGEKGFTRIDEGFCTRPDGGKMREHFLNLDDSKTATQFHASSMESIRSLGGDCLTLVSEMPLFIFPKKDRKLVWPDTYLNEWSDQFTKWKNELISGKLSATALETEMKEKRVHAMPWEDQLKLQWQFIVSGLEAI
ncbi:M14 family zinc carboxypeptidase [Flavobacterium undicola]|uniref:M14 family zinc carboxypeptidase n=1 Tax=Flavobacterium undicola TaxID=1932779 RepID=UPI001378CB67|nr:M14 family zinc carboxypeptidase [Flavobacterium undicola]MBA0882546.1 peptidase [Flavobacterium undicola]